MVHTGVNVRIILKWILNKEDVMIWNGFNWFRIGTSGGCCKHDNEP
jgi:hypothetical protein